MRKILFLVLLFYPGSALADELKQGVNSITLDRSTQTKSGGLNIQGIVQAGGLGIGISSPSSAVELRNSSMTVQGPGSGINVSTLQVTDNIGLRLGGALPSSALDINGSSIIIRGNGAGMEIRGGTLSVIGPGQVTIRNSSITVSGSLSGISASTYTSNNLPLIQSTYTAVNRCFGGTIFIATMTIAANTTVSRPALDFGFTSICGIVCGQTLFNGAVVNTVAGDLSSLPATAKFVNGSAATIEDASCIIVGIPTQTP